MKYIVSASLMIVMFSCKVDVRRHIVFEQELEYSRFKMVREMDAKFDCYKKVLIDDDSTFDSRKPKNKIQKVFVDFSKIIVLRDSIGNIKELLGKGQWMIVLAHFKDKIEALDGVDRKQLAKDFESLNSNYAVLPDNDYGTVYRHIVERWTNEAYESVMSNFAIHFKEGHKPKCRF